MATSTTVSKAAIACYDKLKAKYGYDLQLDGNFYVEGILRVIADLMTDGPRRIEVFQMYTDEMMAEVLDDEDMAVWLERKAELT